MDPTVFLSAIGATGVATVVTFVLWWRARNFLARALQVEGKIASIEVETYEHAGYGSEHPAETSYGYRPQVAGGPSAVSLVQGGPDGDRRV
jgi:hypothetical protein